MSRTAHDLAESTFPGYRRARRTGDTIDRRRGVDLRSPRAHRRRDRINPVSRSPKPITFTFDVEDHRPSQAAWEPRYPELTETVLDWMDAQSITATVFVVGEIAERHPELVRHIAARGHEIGLHNWQHIQLTAQQPDEFRAGVRRGKRLLQDVSGTEVVGFRAPTGSLVPSSAWAIDVLRDEGFAYSSSVCPGRNPINCFVGAPTKPFVYTNGLAEFPAPVAGFRLFNIPYLGGTYLRVLPGPVLQLVCRFAPRDPGAVLYCHPYDFDTEEPFWWVADVGALSPLLWVGRKSITRKLERLVAVGTVGPLRDQLEVARAGEVFDPSIAAAAAA
jgi:polysaccharide deacetylase family protein (PEP-CTERM system associated)